MQKVAYVAYSPLDLQSANSIQTFNTCRALAARLGSELTVVVPRFGWREAPPPFRVVKLPRVPLNKISRWSKTALWSYLERSVYAWLAAVYLRFLRPDVVYVRDIICAYWLVALGVPVIYEVHDLESRHPSKMKGARLSRWLARVDDKTLRGARAVVSLTQTFKDELVRWGWQPAERVFVIPDAYDQAVYFPRPRAGARAARTLSPDAIVIGYAGMTFAYRRLDLLLDALRLWNEPRAQALIIGGRPTEVQELKHHAAELNLMGNITWCGREPAESTAGDLSAADILVIPDTVTDATASPLKMFEYMALGRAIVSVDRPALREILGNGAAEFFHAGDAQDFARVLQTLAQSQARRDALAARALECAQEYTYTRRADKIIAACEATNMRH